VSDTSEVHADKQVVLQQVVADVGATSAGRPVDEVMELIRSAVVAQGLQPPPDRWLQSAAAAAAAGHTYVLTERAVHESDADVPALDDVQHGEVDHPEGGDVPAPSE
jgi:hypothetical protein